VDGSKADFLSAMPYVCFQQVRGRRLRCPAATI
jgi:hypothetical protein